jgi:hypothetical protein
VHFTDTHIQRELKADEGVARCFGRLSKLKPDFCLAGGDSVFDVLERDKSRARELFDMDGGECQHSNRSPLLARNSFAATDEKGCATQAQFLSSAVGWRSLQ